jgi:hypothetical protein
VTSTYIDLGQKTQCRINIRPKEELSVLRFFYPLSIIYHYYPFYPYVPTYFIHFFPCSSLKVTKPDKKLQGQIASQMDPDFHLLLGRKRTIHNCPTLQYMFARVGQRFFIKRMKTLHIGFSFWKALARNERLLTKSRMEDWNEFFSGWNQVCQIFTGRTNQNGGNYTIWLHNIPMVYKM